MTQEEHPTHHSPSVMSFSVNYRPNKTHKSQITIKV